MTNDQILSNNFIMHSFTKEGIEIISRLMDEARKDELKSLKEYLNATYPSAKCYVEFYEQFKQTK